MPIVGTTAFKSPACKARARALPGPRRSSNAAGARRSCTSSAVPARPPEGPHRSRAELRSPRSARLLMRPALHALAAQPRRPRRPRRVCRAAPRGLTQGSMRCADVDVPAVSQDRRARPRRCRRPVARRPRLWRLLRGLPRRRAIGAHGARGSRDPPRPPRERGGFVSRVSCGRGVAGAEVRRTEVARGAARRGSAAPRSPARRRGEREKKAPERRAARRRHGVRRARGAPRRAGGSASRTRSNRASDAPSGDVVPLRFGRSSRHRRDHRDGRLRT